MYEERFAACIDAVCIPVRYSGILCRGLLGGTGVSDARVYDSEGLIKIQTLAIADSIYNGPTSEGEPEIDDIPEILMNGTLVDKKNVLNYISYREVCQNIKIARHIDILRLDSRKAFKEYKNNIGLYADAYVITTNFQWYFYE